MIESLVVALREGIEAALVVGIIIAYLRKTGNLQLSRWVYTGLALALVASLVTGIVFQVLGFDAENEYLEGALFGIAGVLVATMVIWMWRTARNIKRELEAKLSEIVAPSRGKAGGLGLLLFTFVMVFREGIETVLFLFAATLGEFSLLDFTGALLGLALAVLFAVLLIKGSVRINLARFFSITSFVLLLLAIRLLAGSVHEFSEVGVLPMSKEIMSFVGLLVRDSSTTLIMIALLAAPAFMIVWDIVSTPKQVPAQTGAAESPADRRKRLAARRGERRWRVGLVGGSLVAILALASTALAGGQVIDPDPIPVQARDGAIRIALTSLPEGGLQKFSAKAEGVDVRFIAMRHADGTVHAGFDACQICGSVGYMQEGEYAICKNCNAPILVSTIGDPGGCNPMPIDAEVRAGELVVPLPALLEAKKYFAK